MSALSERIRASYVKFHGPEGKWPDIFHKRFAEVESALRAISAGLVDVFGSDAALTWKIIPYATNPAGEAVICIGATAHLSLPVMNLGETRVFIAKGIGEKNPTFYASPRSDDERESNRKFIEGLERDIVDCFIRKGFFKPKKGA
jgi:hypothetical protein